MNKEETSIHAEVILASGTADKTLEHIIENVLKYEAHTGGYYYIMTEKNEYYYPVDRTILTIKKS